MGFTVVVELLAKEYDFDVDTQETLQRNTALHIAVRHSQLACAIVLLQLGADTAIVSVRAPSLPSPTSPCIIFLPYIRLIVTTPPQRDYNATSLSLAMRNHDVRMVEVILTVGLKHGITRPGQDWVRAPSPRQAPFGHSAETVLRAGAQAGPACGRAEERLRQD